MKSGSNEHAKVISLSKNYFLYVFTNFVFKVDQRPIGAISMTLYLTCDLQKSRQSAEMG